MKRPNPKILWHLAIWLLILAVFDIALTTIGIFHFNGKEGNPLIVKLAELLPGSSQNVKVVHMVWLLKITVMASMLLAVRAAVKSKPIDDDKMMLVGLMGCLVVYSFVVSSWVLYFTI